MELQPLIVELKRRRVIRALVGYGIAAFAVLQIIEPIMHGLHWRDEVLSYVVVGLAIGFPLVVSLAWIFDLNAGRIERTPPAAQPALRGPRLAILLVVIGAMSAAPGLIVYFWLLGGAGRAPEHRGPAASSIAVVPFVNMSGDKENEYFSDGMTEELINALANVEGLRVASRTSVFALKGKGLDARQIGKKLSVGTLLEGSVRREGNMLRVTAQLINVGDDVHLWSKTYDREMKSMFALEDEIARSIVQSLRGKLIGSELVKTSTQDLEAHDLYLKGRYVLARRTPETLRKAAGYFEQAVQKDPAYALAWVGLADATSLQDEYDQVLASTVLPKAKLAALRALELDPEMAEAHASLGLISTYLFDWAGAETEYRKAIQLKPAYPTVHHWYALLLSWQGRNQEALDEANEARRLDPTSLIINNLLGVVHLYGRDLEGAVRYYTRTLEMDPGFLISRAMLGGTYAAQGKYAEAEAEFEKSQDLVNRTEGPRGVSYALSGRRADALRLVSGMEERASRGFVSPAARGYIWVALGEKDRGFALLEKACAETDWRLREAKVDPLYGSMRPDPRFQALLKCVHLE